MSSPSRGSGDRGVHALTDLSKQSRVINTRGGPRHDDGPTAIGTADTAVKRASHRRASPIARLSAHDG